VGKIIIHYIDEADDKVIARPTTSYVPIKGDEIRVKGGAGKGQFFKVTRRVWVYDEPGPFARVNIGLEKVGA
jgi:hypothetical protein